MPQNIGHADRIIRIVIGIVLLSLYFVLPGNARLIGLVGLIPLGTALVRWCPLYSLFGLHTCPLGGTK